MNFPDKGKLFDIGKGIIATLALFLAYISLPLAGFLPGLFTPLPGMYYILKSGKSAGLAIVLITTALLAMTAEPLVPLLYLAQSGLISLTLPFFLGKGWGAARAIAFSVGTVSVVLLLAAAIFWLVRGTDPHTAILKGIGASISQTTAIYEKSGLKGDELQALQQGVKEAGDLIARIYPALTLVGLAAIAGLNLLALQRLAARLGSLPTIGDFRKFKNPDHLIWFLIAAGFALLLKDIYVLSAAMNVLVVTVSLYFLQGLAIVIHFFDWFKVGRLFRVIFYVLLTVQPYLAIAVALFGIFDLWGNFRTPKRQENL